MDEGETVLRQYCHGTVTAIDAGDNQNPISGDRGAGRRLSRDENVRPETDMSDPLMGSDGQHTAIQAGHLHPSRICCWLRTYICSYHLMSLSILTAAGLLRRQARNTP